jgi:MFS family permease
MEEIIWTIEWVAWRLPQKLLARQAFQIRRMFGMLKGNTRALVIYNLFWTIPGSFMGVYLQLFMAEQGLTKIEIGSIASAQITVQMIGALFAAWLAERFGRLRSITTFDAICWPAAYLLFAMAGGYLPFMGGAMLIGGIFFMLPSWTSLFVSGTPVRNRTHLFALLQVPWFIGSITASLSGFLVDAWGLDLTCRVVFGCAAVSTAFAVWIRSKYLRDPDPPRRPIRLTLDEVESAVAGHLYALKALVNRRQLFIFFLIQVATAAWLALVVTYNFLYLADPRGVGLPKPALAALPLFSGATVVITSFFIVPFVTVAGVTGFLLIGVGLSAIQAALLLAAPHGAFASVAGAVVVGAVGWGIFNPSLNGRWSTLMSDRERTRILSFTTVLSMLITMPVPTIAGALYMIHPRWPLILVLCCHAMIVACIVWAALVRGNTRIARRR